MSTNQGLKSYSKLLSFSLPGIATEYVNLCQKYRNSHVIFNLLGFTNTKTPLALSLVYSPAITQILWLGNSARLNLSRTFDLSSDQTTIVVGYPDGSTLVFTKTEDYGATLKYECFSTTDYIIMLANGAEFNYYDSSNTRYMYGMTITPYSIPKAIFFANKEVIYASIGDYHNNYPDVVFSNSDNEKLVIVFNTQGYFYRFEHYISINNQSVLQNYFSLNYQSNYINGIIGKLQNESIVSNLSIEYGSNNKAFKVQDNISNQYFQNNYNSTGEYITSVTEGHLNGLTNITSLQYQLNETIVTNNYSSNVSTLYFDGSNLPQFSYDNFGNFSAEEFNIKHALIQSSGVISLIGDPSTESELLSNFLFNNNFSSWTKNVNSTSSIVTDNYIPCKEIIGNTCVKIPTDNYLTQTIEYSSKGETNFSIFLLGKGCGTYATGKQKVNLKFYYYNELVHEKDCAFVNEHLTEWQVRCFGINLKKFFSRVVVTISGPYNCAADNYCLFKAVGIYAKPIESIIAYDSSNKIRSYIKNGVETVYSYYVNEYVYLPNEVSSPTGQIVSTKYNENNMVEKKTNIFGYSSSFVYDEHKNLTSVTSKQTNSSVPAPQTTSYEYDTNNRNVVKETYADDTYSTFEYNQNKNLLTKVTNPLSQYSEYTYDDFNQIATSTSSSGTASNTITNTYNGKFLLTFSSTVLSSQKMFTYDTSSRLIDIREFTVGYSPVKYVTYTYGGNASYTNANNVVEKKYGIDGDKYLLSYDEFNRLQNVKYVKEGTTTQIDKYSFAYNSVNNITSIISECGGDDVNYEYDASNRLSQFSVSTNAVKYCYDERNDLSQTIFTNSTSKRYSLYDLPSRIMLNNPASAIQVLESSQNYYFASMYEKSKNGYGFDPTNTSLVSINKDYGVFNGMNTVNEQSISYDVNLPCIHLSPSSHTIISYDANYSTNSSFSIGFWFKTALYSPQHSIFAAKFNSNDDRIIELKMQLDNRIGICKKYANTTTLLFTSTSAIVLGQWCFISLSFTANDETNTNDIYKLTINKTSETFVASSHISGGNKLKTLAIGSNIDSTSYYAGEYTFFYLSKDGKSVSDLEIEQMYSLTNEYLISMEPIYPANTAYKTFARTTGYVGNDLLFANNKFLPLNNDFSSIDKNYHCSFFKNRVTNSIDKDPNFNYDNDSKKYCYYADGNRLEYNMDNSASSGTLAFKFKFYEKSGLQTLAELFGTFRSFIVYRSDTSNEILFSINGVIRNTGIFVSDTNWHTFAIAYSRTVISESTQQYSYNFRVMVDTYSYETTSSTILINSAIRASIGARHTPRVISSVEYYDHMHAYIQSAFINNLYSSTSGVAALYTSLKFDTAEYDFDGKDLVKRRIVTTLNNTTVANTYEYNALTNSITSENINFSNGYLLNFTYLYDALGNITQSSESINSSLHTISDYEYNYLGYLTKETISMANANEYKYNFDGNGNITSVTKNNATYKTFQYTNPLNKTQLTKFNNKTIDYDSYYQGNPIKYGTTINGTFTGIRFSYEGRKLVSYIDNSLVDPKTITYEYDYGGVRTKKIVNGVTTSYFYEGSKLILEKTNNITKEYSYDTSGLLYSLRYYNGSIYQNYYYVYNASGLIIGLTNELGELVINYAYDAYGNILSTSGDDNHINSILYKGYYLDYETNLYYCSSRYYVPLWYRWLNADDVSYLDNGSSSGLNLFLYCNNNPVMYADPSGHFVITAIIIGALIGAAVGFATVCYSDYQDDGLIFNGSVDWQTYVSGTLTGSILGALCGGIIGAGGIYLTGAISSSFGKLLTDLFAHSLTGAPIGTWEDYAIAFAFGGLTVGFGKTAKIFLDIFAIPAITQIAKMGTGRQAEFNLEKYGYDIITRAITSTMPAPWKNIMRGFAKGYWFLWDNSILIID